MEIEKRRRSQFSPRKSRIQASARPGFSPHSPSLSRVVTLTFNTQSVNGVILNFAYVAPIFSPLFALVDRVRRPSLGGLRWRGPADRAVAIPRRRLWDRTGLNLRAARHRFVLGRRQHLGKTFHQDQAHRA